jgi:hypothetical protein
LDLLQRRLDGEAVGERTALDVHLAACAECRERHAAVPSLNAGLRRLALPAPPAGLSARIASRALAERRAALGFRRRVMTAAAIAAGLLLACLAGLQLSRWATSEPDESRQAKKPVPHVPDRKVLAKNNDETPAVPGPSLDETLSQAGAATVALTRKAAGQTVARAQQWLPRTPMLTFSIQPLHGGELDPVLGPLAQTLRQAGEAVSTGLQPVTTSAPRALHTCTDFVGMFLQDASPASTGNKS